MGKIVLKAASKKPVKKEKKVSVGKCAQCKKEMSSYVVANGLRFCGDVCCQEFLTK